MDFSLLLDLSALFFALCYLISLVNQYIGLGYLEAKYAVGIKIRPESAIQIQ